ncbi:SDR family NAD(P)-dependent oxidoreductase [Rhizobium sp. RAF56]|jgi:short-subunit dehydrogenase|uniref:SDR family NAD(P)-dependent oxidoreductase n=1 Tax=Rhizobium sp. RAF56 TaxID=3233062 RepID=UPI003F978444
MATQSKGTALVTGASTGIGAVYADRLARRGYDLILVARNGDKLASLASRVSAETGCRAEIVTADLVDKADLGRVESILRTNETITLLVNNAGLGGTEPLLSSEVDAMERMIELNVTALTRLTYAAVPGLVKRGGGAIINIASVVAVAPEILNGVYGGSKAYVLAFSQSLRHELSDKNIRVQAVLPGATATDFWEIAGKPVEHLPSEIVMSAEAMVDAALAGFDQGEFATVPALSDVGQWDAFEGARQALMPNLSRAQPAERYKAA